MERVPSSRAHPVCLPSPAACSLLRPALFPFDMSQSTRVFTDTFGQFQWSLVPHTDVSSRPHVCASSTPRPPVWCDRLLADLAPPPPICSRPDPPSQERAALILLDWDRARRRRRSDAAAVGRDRSRSARVPSATGEAEVRGDHEGGEGNLEGGHMDVRQSNTYNEI